MPEQNEKNLPKAPAFNPKVKETIAAFKENNNPKKLNDILNELVRSPLLAPAVFDLQGQPAPKPEADGRVQLPKETKISLVMVTSPEGKRYYLGFSDWDAVHEWQKAQPKAAQQIILLRFDDYANMIAKNTEASGLVINPGDNSLRLERPLIESVKKTKDEVSQKIAAQLAEQQARAAFSSQTMPWDSHSLFLGKELYGKHNNSNRKHNLNDKRNQHRQQ